MFNRLLTKGIAPLSGITELLQEWAGVCYLYPKIAKNGVQFRPPFRHASVKSDRCFSSRIKQCKMYPSISTGWPTLHVNDHIANHDLGHYEFAANNKPRDRDCDADRAVHRIGHTYQRGHRRPNGHRGNGERGRGISGREDRGGDRGGYEPRGAADGGGGSAEARSCH